MGMCFLLYLMAYLAINLFIVLSSEVPISENENLRALTSLLLALDSSLSKFITYPKFIRISLTPTNPTQLYSQSNITIQLDNPSGYLFFTYVSLQSSEFYLQEPPSLHSQYFAPYTLSVVFSPSSIGVRTAYLVIKTQDEFLVYYLQGVSEENKYKMKPVSMKYQGEIYGKLKLTNPEDIELTAQVRKSEGFEPGVLDLNLKAYKVSNSGNTELLLFKIKKKGFGKLTGKIWVTVNNQLFFVPINGSRKTHKIDCGGDIDLGILTFTKQVYKFDIKCEKDPSFLFNFSSISTSTQNAWVVPNKIPNQSENFVLGSLFVHVIEPGMHSELIKVNCENETFVISFKYLVNIDILQTDLNDLYFAQSVETTHKLCFKNFLNHEIWIREFSVSSELILVEPESFFISSEESMCLEMKMKDLYTGSFTLNMESNIGKLVFPIYSIEPYVTFWIYKDKRLKQLYGLLDFGNLGTQIYSERKIVIKNPTHFSITIYTIQAFPNISIQYSPNTIVPSQGQYEFTVSIKSDSPVYAPLKIATSIGLFYFTIYSNILSGSVKVKNIVVSDLYPKSHKIENIVMVNYFPVPVKIFSITAYGENLSTSKEIIEAPANGNQVIGRITASVKLHEKTNVDFKKSITYGDIKRWNLVNQYEEGEKTYEIKILTDLVGEIKATVVMQVKKPTVFIKQLAKGSNCLLKSFCTVSFLVTNPLDIPIRSQLFAVPDNFSLASQKLDCASEKKFQDFFDEEFENLAPEQNSATCDKSLFSDHDEIKAVKSANDQKVILNKKLEFLSFTEKLIWFLTKTLQLTEPQSMADQEKPLKPSQSLYINDPINFTLPPFGSKLIGPLLFHPQSMLSSIFPIILKNNYTILEQSNVHINIKNKKLSITKKTNYNFNDRSYSQYRSSLIKESQKLQFDLNPEEISKFFISPQTIYSPIIFKTFDLQNIGNVDIEIKGVFFDGNICKSQGYQVYNCGEEVLLKPGEVYPIEISYKLVESWSNNYFKLIVLTDDEDFHFVIDTFIVEGLNINNFLYIWAEIYYLFNVTFVLALFLTTIRQSCRKKKKSFEIKTSKDASISVYQQYFCKKYSQPIMFTTHEEIIQVPEPVIPVHLNEPISKPVKKIRKNFKNNKNFTNVIQASELEKKPTRKMPEVFATNKFLIEKSKNRKLAHSHSLSEDKSEVVEEDFFIDAYKNTNQLFAGYVDRESYSLAELTQDSDPIDTDSKLS